MRTLHTINMCDVRLAGERVQNKRLHGRFLGILYLPVLPVLHQNEAATRFLDTRIKYSGFTLSRQTRLKQSGCTLSRYTQSNKDAVHFLSILHHN